MAAIALLLYSTPQGLGINDDSIAYIAGARSLLSGQGYRELWLVSAGYVTHFPPGFPGALAFISLLTGIDPLRSARLLNSLLFGLNVAIMGWLGLRMTSSRVAGLLTAVLFVLTPSILRVHASAMSEPLYVFSTLLVMLLMDVYFRRSASLGSWLWLVAAGLLIGLAYLTRYAALALLAMSIAALIILHDKWHVRLNSAAVLITAFLPALLGWAIRNRIVGGSLTNREIGWHPISDENVRTGLRTFSEFIVPVDSWQLRIFRVDGLFIVCLTALLLILIIWLLPLALKRFLRGSQTQRVEIIAFLNGLYIFAYFLALLVTMILLDPATKFQLRILAPIFVSLLLLLSYGLFRLSRHPGFKPAALGIIVLVLAVSAYGQGRTLADLRRGGQVFANERWFDAPAIQILRELPTSTIIHSNQPGVVYLYVGRPGALLPDGPSGVAQLQEKVRAGQAVIAIFRTAGLDEETQEFYALLGAGLASQKYNGDVIYSAP